MLMPMVRVIDRDGTERELEAPSGATLMEPLRDMDDGVAAICGGMCSCATCHVYVDAEWLAKLPAAMSDESDMLGDLTSRRENSRLSCQIVLNDALSGLKVSIAPEE
jgi:2Fe-2S ferredoxin